MYVQDPSWRGYGLGRGLGELCSNISKPAGFMGPVDCEGLQSEINRTVDPNVTTLLDPFHIYEQDNGAPTGVVRKDPPAAGAAGWLERNALTVGIALAASAIVIGALKR